MPCEHHKINTECSICRHAMMHNAYHEMNKQYKKQLTYYDLEGNKI